MFSYDRGLAKLTKDNVNKKISNFLYNAQFILDLDVSEFANEVEITSAKMKKALSGEKSLKLDEFESILERLNVGFYNIIVDDIDYKAILKQFNKSLDYIPDRYSYFAKSRKRTLSNIFQYVKDTRGEIALRTYLRDFQVRPEAFEDKAESINHNFLCDFLKYLFLHGYSLEDIEHMGKYSYQCNKDSLMAQNLKEYRSPQELLEVLTQELSYLFDTNYDYKIQKMNKDFCYLEMQQNQEIADAFNVEKIGNELVNLYKQGTISTLSHYVDSGPCTVKTIKSVFDGDSSNLYLINFHGNVH